MADQPAVPVADQPAVSVADQPAVAPTARAAPPGPAAAPAADGSAGIRRKLLAIEPGRRRTALLIRHCRELAAQVVGGSIADIDPAAPLASLGFDSMRTLELRARLEQSLDVKLSAAVGWQFPTLEALAPFLAERMGIGLVAAGPDPAGGRPRPPGQDQRAEVGDLSDSQIEALLMARLEQLDAGN